MNTINQNGNTILAVIIAVFITAFVVGGGVYFWQNIWPNIHGRDNVRTIQAQIAGLRQSPANNISSQTQTTSQKIQEGLDPCDSGNMSYYKIPELGIKIGVDKSIKDDIIHSTVIIDDRGDGMLSKISTTVYVSFKSLIEKSGDSCTFKNGGAFYIMRKNTLGMMGLSPAEKSKIMRQENLTKIGEHYVILFGSRDWCSKLTEYESELVDKSIVMAKKNGCIKAIDNN